MPCKDRGRLAHLDALDDGACEGGALAAVSLPCGQPGVCQCLVGRGSVIDVPATQEASSLRS